MLGFSPCCTPVVGMYMWLLFVLFLAISPTAIVSVLPPEPSFVETIPNITITAGREAVLQCVVDNLGVHRVAWIKADTQTVLTFHTQVITHNSRIFISHNGLRNWDLHIKQIHESDRGLYMCQVNSSPMKKQVAQIEVVVPPDIIYDETSSDLAVSEGSSATMVCRATGHPKPKLSWQREDGEPIVVKNALLDKIAVSTLEGETLTLNKVSRKSMGAYLCIATNGVPPAVSRRIYLQVNFEPTIKVPSQMIGAAAGGEVIMECLVEASPRSVNYWIKDSGTPIFFNEKYDVRQQENVYKIHMQLKIRYLDRKDFGRYRCLAKNSMGEAEGDVKLYELQISSTKTKVDSEDSRISFRIEEHIGGNDSASLYKPLDSKKNLLIDGSNPSYSDKEYNSPRGGNTVDNDVHYPSAKNTPDDAASDSLAPLSKSPAMWWIVLFFAFHLGRTTMNFL